MCIQEIKRKTFTIVAVFWILLCLSVICEGVDTPLSTLPAGGVVGSTDVFVVVQGTVTYKVTGAQLITLMETGMTNLTVISATSTTFSGDLLMDRLDDPTWKYVQDWSDTTQSAGKLDGGGFTDNGDGTLTVEAGSGIIKIINSATGANRFFDWSQSASIGFSDNDTSYVYVDYAAGSPAIATSADIPTDHNTKILLGLVYRDGTDLHTTTAGQVISNINNRVFWKDIEVNGNFQRATGLILSATGTRNITVTTGIVYAGMTKQSYAAFDSSSGDSFISYYSDGASGWTEIADVTQIDNSYYDNGSGTLEALNNNYSTNRYIYMDSDGHLFMVYGTAQYVKLADALEESAPSDIPDLLKDIGLLIGKIIIEKDASTFSETLSAFADAVTYSGVTDHNDLGNIQGGDNGCTSRINRGFYCLLRNEGTITVSAQRPVS